MDSKKAYEGKSKKRHRESHPQNAAKGKPQKGKPKKQAKLDSNDQKEAKDTSTDSTAKTLQNSSTEVTVINPSPKSTDKGGVHSFLHSLRAKAVNLLPRQIHFQRARIPDTSNESMKKKYISLSSEMDAKTIAQRQKEAVRETVDPNAFQPPSYYLYPQERMVEYLSWKNVSKVGGGVKNMGNTCYLSAALQCLAYTPPIANYVQSREHSRSCRATGFCYFCQVEQTLLAMMGEASGAVSPNQLIAGLQMVAKAFRLGQPEDVHEYLRFAIDLLHRNCLQGLHQKVEPKIAQTSFISQVFGGYMQQIIECQKCSFRSFSYPFFMDISLELKGNPTLCDAIGKHFKPEMLKDDNAYYCPSCRSNTDSLKKTSIQYGPNVLMIHLKRSDFGPGRLSKLDKMIAFPENLSLDQYILDKHTPISYGLYAVISHTGSEPDSGHFVTFAKNSNQVWYKFDDSIVSQVSLSTVLAQKPYILLYSKTSAAPMAIKQANSSANQESSKLADNRTDELSSTVKTKTSPKQSVVGQSKQNTALDSDDSSSSDDEPISASKMNSVVKDGGSLVGLWGKSSQLKLNPISQANEEKKSKELQRKRNDTDKQTKLSAPGAITQDNKQSNVVSLSVGKSEPMTPSIVNQDLNAPSTVFLSDESSSDSDSETSIVADKSSNIRPTPSAPAQSFIPDKQTSQELMQILRPKSDKFSSFGQQVEQWNEAPGVEEMKEKQQEIISQNITYMHKKEKERRKYDEEYDTGKLKKIKVKQPMRDPRHGNPFQKMHERREKDSKRELLNSNYSKSGRNED
eukprot:TRINITY_DN10279_c0_g4_i1.p1 TRINITY_DN10279_c0_g4~~TRINITY_DN10279_c0_g4_i1.p1  ORF type:complete len:796 (+),score=172.05 TRINITY_DN10279_c0_g4_i1:50-2437(+)